MVEGKVKRVVWKVQLALVVGPQQVAMPRNAQVVHVAEQADIPTLWFETVYPPNVETDRWFQLFDTGDPSIPEEASRLGTIQLRSTPTVLHVYQLRGPSQ